MPRPLSYKLCMKTTRKCRTCKRIFEPSSGHKDCPRCRRRSEQHPCLQCSNIIWGPATLCVKCNNARLSGKALGVISHKKGYIMELVRGQARYVFQHILVMERILDRPLLETEHVHHINGIKDDNRAANLELWVRPHPTGIRARDALCWARQIIKTYNAIEKKL